MKTGFHDLDQLVDLENNSLNVICARPGMGKTNFVLSMGVNIARQNINVAIFSLEETKEMCVKRILCQEAMIDMKKIREAKLDAKDWERVEKSINKFLTMKLFIDDTPVIEIEKFKEECIKLKREQGIEIIIIDYLQLIKGKQKEICANLKELANELNIPIVVVSTLAREPEERYEQGKNPNPQLTDANSDIIQYADVIMALYREDYYYKDTDMKNIMQVKVIKNKKDKLGTVSLLALDTYMKFVNIDPR